ncbi:uncharacterized protein LOC133815691 [Humulus lupulus]|uniref:uncharacterized protein LOC133815691 n=1 Tax=Humulus lupulus TaxID=3486 RepID=UPI002B401B04|nr:uncharacterized protein LOC133815691 [Humulus lupulus]
MPPKNNEAPSAVAPIAPATDVSDQIDKMCRLLEASQQRSDEAIRALTAAQAKLEATIAELRKANEATRKTQDKESPNLDGLGTQKEEMLREVMQKFSDERSAYDSDYVELFSRITERSPFAEWIQNEPKPRDFLIPPLPEFNGKGDPLNHLFQFKQKMALEVNNEAIQCKVFSTTFFGPSLLWFRQLNHDSDSSFEDLRRAFLQQYNANCEAPRTMANLYQIEQGENEQPKLYLQRFINLVHQIHDVEPATTANLFVKSLQVGSLLHENLTMTPPYDMAKIQARAEGMFRVLEYRERAQKKSALISMPPPNNPSPPSTRDEKRKRQELDHTKGGKRPGTSRDPPRYSSFKYTVP